MLRAQIDTLLAHIVRHVGGKPGKATPASSTLGSSQAYIRTNSIGGGRFTHAENVELDDIRNDRNTYLHRANAFPSDPQVRRFLRKTSHVVGAALRFTP